MYGCVNKKAGKDHVRLVQGLTPDLEKITDDLFSLEPSKGKEFCGKAINAAVDGLAWSASDDDFKAIFIAGNEAFNKGDLDYKKACKKASDKGIVVNTVFCGKFKDGIRLEWQKGASLADGTYINIDDNFETSFVENFSGPQFAALDKAKSMEISEDADEEGQLVKQELKQNRGVAAAERASIKTPQKPQAVVANAKAVKKSEYMREKEDLIADLKDRDKNVTYKGYSDKLTGKAPRVSNEVAKRVARKFKKRQTRLEILKMRYAVNKKVTTKAQSKFEKAMGQALKKMMARKKFIIKIQQLDNNKDM